MHSTVAYDDVAGVLGARASAVHPAEAHGCLCGALCVRRDYASAEWLDEILPEGEADGGAEGPLEALFVESAGSLARPDMEFEPLLPGDDAGLGVRVEALAAWCQGFLYGFGAAGTARSALPEDVREVLADFAQVSQAGVTGADAVEIEEGAYAELVEFVRAGVQLVYEELDALRASEPHSPSAH
jgi:hypothetical protein